MGDTGAGVVKMAEGGRTSVYICYDAHGQIIYVGISKNITKRLSDHDDPDGWWAEVRKIDVEHFSTRAGASAREHLLVLAYQPRHNTALKHAGAVLKGPAVLPVRTAQRLRAAEQKPGGRSGPVTVRKAS